MTELSDKIQQYIEVDDSGQDNDTIEIRGEDGKPVTVPLNGLTLYREIDSGNVVLPDGTPFTTDDCQLAFQDELIAKTGMCVLEHEYHRLGQSEDPEIASMAEVMKQMAKGARS